MLFASEQQPKNKLSLRKRLHRRAAGQSFVELAIIIPVMIVILLGVIEIAFFLGRYLDILDLTREAARFASVRDPFDTAVARDFDCSTPNLFDFYYDTACVFSPPNTGDCQGNALFCNGLNTYLNMDPTLDDVVITIYTVSGGNVTDAWPASLTTTGHLIPDPDHPGHHIPGYWALSNLQNYLDPSVAKEDNFKKDCQGNYIPGAAPYYNRDRVQAALEAGAPPTKGFVAIEYYYCYHQVLGNPFFTAIIPNPMRIHAYTLMPLPAAQPTPTPTTVPIP